MSILKKQRSRKSFDEKLDIKSPNTKLQYKKAIANFEKFCSEKYKNNSVEDIINELKIASKKDQDIVFDVLQDWINWNSKRLSPAVVRTWFSCLRGYLHYCGVKLHPQDVKENLDFPQRIEEELHPLSEGEIRKILSVANHQKKALYLAQLSSGMRLGELMRIRKKDLILSQKRIVVKIPATFTKKNRARTTFFSREAQKAILPYLKRLGDDDLIFYHKSSADRAVNTEEHTLIRYCEKVGLDQRYPSSSRHKITSHSFRAYFITKISRHDENFAKKLAGQKGYLLQYDRMTDEEKLEKYLEFEPALLVFDESKKNAELEKLKKENKEPTQNRQLIDDLQTQLVQLQFELKAVRTSVQAKYDDELQQRKEKLVIG